MGTTRRRDDSPPDDEWEAHNLMSKAVTQLHFAALEHARHGRTDEAAFAGSVIDQIEGNGPRSRRHDALAPRIDREQVHLDGAQRSTSPADAWRAPLPSARKTLHKRFAIKATR